MIGIDPGVSMSAYAIATDRVLTGCGLLKKVKADLFVAQALKSQLDQLRINAPLKKLSHAIIEYPMIYDRQAQSRRVDPNDLVKVAFIAGGYAALFGTLGSVVWLPKPREWKGSVPKHIHNARLMKRFPEIEKLIIGFPPSYRHNVIDAIGLVDWGLSQCN